MRALVIDWIGNSVEVTVADPPPEKMQTAGFLARREGDGAAEPVVYRVARPAVPKGNDGKGKGARA